MASCKMPLWSSEVTSHLNRSNSPSMELPTVPGVKMCRLCEQMIPAPYLKSVDKMEDNVDGWKQ